MIHWIIFSYVNTTTGQRLSLSCLLSSICYSLFRFLFTAVNPFQIGIDKQINRAI